MDAQVIVFVVEDEAPIVDILRAALEDAGFAVTTATSAEGAIELLAEQGTRFSALLTDINLGKSKLTGWDVAKHAREIKAHIPVVYMTGASGHEWGSSGVPNSILVTKPFANAQIVTAISQLLQQLVIG